jgi:hypothetical protein
LKPTGFSSGQDLTTDARESGIISSSASGETCVPQSQEKTPEPSTELPNPELNPLLNPTLGRHLGRWAQVYFTSPPEKREEAVGELLRELQAQPAVESAAPVEAIRIVEDVVNESPVQQCSQCGHAYTSPQRFCGMCGFALEAEPLAAVPPVPKATPPHRPVFTHTDLPSLLPVREPRPADDGLSEIRWLREKSFAGEGSSWRRSTTRYAPAVVAVLAIGILFYAQSRPQNGPARQSERAAPSPAPNLQTPVKAAPAPPAASSLEKAPLKTSEDPAASATPQAGAPSIPAQVQQPPASASALSATNTKPQSAAARTSSVFPPEAPDQTTAATNAQNGAAELAMAEDFLNGRTHPRNTAEAAKYLWRAVGKENPSAILLLSDMYLAGDGVPRSCDQARLLLGAAARKGVPQAAEKLRGLLRSGCPK